MATTPDAMGAAGSSHAAGAGTGTGAGEWPPDAVVPGDGELPQAPAVADRPANVPAGVMPVAVDPATRTAFMLLGQESSGTWCSFQGNQDRTDLDVFDTAAREAAEEGCAAFGSRRQLRHALLHAPRHELFQGGFMLRMGTWDEAARLRVQLRFMQHRYADGLGRALSRCEKEMRQVCWVPLSAVMAACRDRERGRRVAVPCDNGPLVLRLRSWFGDMLCGLFESASVRGVWKDLADSGVWPSGP